MDGLSGVSVAELLVAVVGLEQSGPGPGCSKLTTSLVNVSLKFEC